MRHLMALLMLASLPVQASEWKLIELKEVRADYAKFLFGGRDPLITSNGIPNKTLGERLNLTVNNDICKYLFWNNTVHSMTDKDIPTGAGQFRMVGLESRVGVNISKYFDVSYYHFSKHVLDSTYAHERFPVQDAIELRVFFYLDSKKNTLF